MKKTKTNLLVKIDKLAWLEFRLIYESAEKTKDKAFEEAVTDYIKKNRKLDNRKLSEGL